MSTRVAKSQPTMRKEPRQARSRATVELMLEAGARVLSSEGWAGFSTNRIAELAGVSIGSLYQYFPDKVTLVAAIRQRHLDDCLAILRDMRPDGLTASEFADRLVGDMIAAHSIYPGLHRALLDEAPSSDEYLNPNSAFEREYLGYYVTAIAHYYRRAPNAADHVAALVMSDAIDGVIHNAARRGALKDAAVRQELTRLVGLYLGDAVEQE